MRREATMAEQRGFIRDAATACRHISRFVEGRGREDLSSDMLFQSAVVRQIEVLGDACTHVGTRVRMELPDVPW